MEKQSCLLNYNWARPPVAEYSHRLHRHLRVWKIFFIYASRTQQHQLETTPVEMKFQPSESQQALHSAQVRLKPKW